MAEPRLTSPAFDHDAPLPARFFADAEDRSPPLQWHDLPEGARELAVVCEDPDHDEGVFTHWVVYGIPPSEPGLEEALPRSAIVSEPTEFYQGLNEFGEAGYTGPTRDERPHRLFFRLLVLDAELVELPPGATSAELREAAKGHVVATTEMVGIAE